MAVQLDLKRIFSSPLGAQPFCFRGFAYGAIPLFPVLTVKGVPILAMRLPRVNGWDGIAIPKGVFGLSDALKVLRIYASRISAHMVNNKVITDWSMEGEPCNAVRASVLPSKPKSSVPILIQMPIPYVASSVKGEAPLGIKARLFFRSEVHGVSLCMGLKGRWLKRGCQYALD